MRPCTAGDDAGGDTDPRYGFDPAILHAFVASARPPASLATLFGERPRFRCGDGPILPGPDGRAGHKAVDESRYPPD